LFRLDNKVAVVTGAGSLRGIGRETCIALSELGASVAALDLDEEGTESTASFIRNAGGNAVHFVCDVTNENQVKEIMDRIKDHFGRIDILVNNAGITQRITVEKTTLEDWNRILGVHATGTFLCSRTVIPIMRQNSFGRIVNVSSVSAKRGGGVFGGAHYSAAKAAMLGFGKALAREVAQYGITVNAVTPGVIDTDIRGYVLSEEERKELTKDIPISRLGLTREVAATICFLSSEEAGYITGEEVDINGGSHID
jgi:3-oxoacyl-[acyl-carrier protein] reductase